MLLNDWRFDLMSPMKSECEQAIVYMQRTKNDKEEQNYFLICYSSLSLSFSAFNNGWKMIMLLKHHLPSVFSIRIKETFVQ